MALSNGQTKTKVAERVAAWIQLKEIQRTISAVMEANKTAHIEGLMGHTHDWCYGITGKGLKDTFPLGY